jgi:hypothetical protein
MSKKIGEGHASAMLRQGFHELQNAMYTQSNVAQRQAEPGSFMSPTQGEIAAERKEEKAPPGKESILDQHARESQVQSREAPAREVPEPERD